MMDPFCGPSRLIVNMGSRRMKCLNVNRRQIVLVSVDPTKTSKTKRTYPTTPSIVEIGKRRLKCGCDVACHCEVGGVFVLVSTPILLVSEGVTSCEPHMERPTTIRDISSNNVLPPHVYGRTIRDHEEP